MQLGGIHRVQLAHVFGTAPPSNHNRAAFAIDLGNRSGFENEVAIGKDLGDFRHDSCGKGVFALEFTFGFVPVLNGAGDGGQSLGLGVVRTELFVQQSAEVGPLVDSGVQVSAPLGGEFRRALAATVFTDQHFNQIVFVEGSRFVLARSVSHLQVAGVPWITGVIVCEGFGLAASGRTCTLGNAPGVMDGAGGTRTEAGPAHAVNERRPRHTSRFMMNPPSVPPHRPSGGCRAESLHHQAALEPVRLPWPTPSPVRLSEPGTLPIVAQPKLGCRV